MFENFHIFFGVGITKVPTLKFRTHCYTRVWGTPSPVLLVLDEPFLHFYWF